MEATHNPFQDKAREVQERVAPRIEEARQELSDLNQRIIGFIKERPGTCLLGALAVGFVVGKIASRR